jgi:hypothetical protein
VFYLTYGSIALATNGPGRITANFTGNQLAVGRNYTVTALPAAGNVFSNWTGSLTSHANPLTFQMVSNMTLVATFSSNIFLASAGVYNGLFYASNEVDVFSAGMIQNLTLRTNGSYSGRLLLAGTNYPLAGAFDATGLSDVNAGPLAVSLTLQQSPTNQITGTVSGVDFGTNWTANVLTGIAGTNHASAEYTMLFVSSGDTNAPPGQSYALVTNHAGAFTFSAALADGSSFSENVPASPTGDIPIYASPYPGLNSGLFFGWVNYTNFEVNAPATSLTWIKKPSAATLRYVAGFTNIVGLQASRWTVPAANAPAIAVPRGTLAIFTNSALLSPIQYTVAVLGNNTVEKLGGAPTNSLTGTIKPATGMLTLTFGNGNGTATTQANGVILQDANEAAGFYLTPTNSDGFLLTR